jgi:hypothetical protein
MLQIILAVYGLMITGDLLLVSISDRRISSPAWTMFKEGDLIQWGNHYPKKR